MRFSMRIIFEYQVIPIPHTVMPTPTILSGVSSSPKNHADIDIVVTSSDASDQISTDELLFYRITAYL